MAADFTHLAPDGSARMVDVGDKHVSDRRATAMASVIMQAETYAAVVQGTTPKGDVFAVARIAGIMAAKRTAELIPLCHPLSVSRVAVDFACDQQRHAIDITATCRVAATTGVEMEALTAAAIAALTIYDMCKALSHDIRITDLRLIEKTGGKSAFIAANE